MGTGTRFAARMAVAGRFIGLAVALQWACSAGAQPVDETAPAHVTFGQALDLEGSPVKLVSVPPPAPAGTPELLPLLGPSLMPVASARISSGFGMRVHPLLGMLRMHSGVDLPVPSGSPVHATADGLVGGAGQRGGYGLTVDIQGKQGVETRFAHLSRLNVVAGERITRGQLLGWSGSTGLSTGPHLHYEVRVRGRPVNPLRR